MLDARYVWRADEIPDDLWAVIEPVLLPTGGPKGASVERPPVAPGSISRGVGVKPRSGGEVEMRAVRRRIRGW